jgi:glycosyltransferase involved in cell wall biosynthesis
VIGAVARLDPLKGLDTLVDACAVVRADRPDAELVVIGSPVLDQERYAEEFETRVARTPGTRLLTGRDDIPDAMADLDVLALPSIEPESYGLVLVEALASGTPVVATDHGGPPEIVARAAPGTARAVPPGDADALAAALLELLPAHTSPERRRARRRAFTPPPPRFAEVFRAVADHPGR